MNNHILLFVHATLICSLSLLALKIGREALIAWLSLLGVAMNLFVLKQINLFGLSVTASDVVGVGYLLGLNLIQEFFGRKLAQKAVWIAFFSAIAFMLLSHIHLLYNPNSFDDSQEHFLFLFSSLPRIIFASLFSFLTISCIDIAFFSYLQKKSRFLFLRTTFSLLLSQTVDTILFSFLALSGKMDHLFDLIFFSLLVKYAVIFCTTPFVSFAKRIVQKDITQEVQ